jgi:predicted type IV restriction endonuclease
MSVPTQIVHPVDQFRDQLQAVKSPQYKEAWVRVNYIDPFFKALGWDVHQENSGTLVHKEVVHEDSLRVEGAMKAPDYCFYTGGTRKFFVEAKKPSVNLFDGRAAAFQLRRYAWSAKLPLSILTDFEELAIHDCRVRPQQEDGAATARSLYMTHEEYPDRWDEIASLFSKEAVLSGSLDAYAQEAKKKRGIATVDEAFLKEMEGWREMLAQDSYRQNPWLSRRELNYAVQMTIDRIVFLRICEDRGIEDYGNLESLLGKDDVYENLCAAFRDADDRYNSGLFHFGEERRREELPDDLTLGLKLDDGPLKKIIKGLYYPESPYQFSVMPVEILGQVYEQFLGRVISIAPDHRVAIEEKPEVRKAGGVYYTPSYIVDYIVENTVGKLLEGKTPRQVSTLKVLDPACGSGSFLIGAYAYLLEWYREWYVNDGPDKHCKVIYEGAGGEWQLTSAKKKDVLLNNIYGVDIDPQAVEVTKLSLLLKVLEGETNESINSQLTFFKERALPDLDNNIKCGNSLIGSDFYNDGQIGLLDEKEQYRVNAFDWEEEFPQIMKKARFYVVLGNPPYISMETFKDLKTYLKSRYASHDERSDLYSYFVERGHRLLRTGGRFGMIVSNKFLRAKYGTPLREFLNRHSAIERIVDFAGLPVFPGATVRTVVLITRRDPEGTVSITYTAPAC